MFVKLCLVCVVVVSVLCDEDRDVRKPRLFTFESSDDDNVSINLEFSVPFLTISTKNALTSALGIWSGNGLSAININPSALAIGGAAVLATTILLPLFVKSFAIQHTDKRYSRLLDSTQFSSDAFLGVASELLSKSQGVHGCPLRLACWMAQSSRFDSGILHDIMSNALVSSMVNSTAIEDAVYSGRIGLNCMKYTPCPINEDAFMMFKNSLSDFSNAIV